MGRESRTSSVGGHASRSHEIVLLEPAPFYTLLCHCVARCEEYLSHMSVLHASIASTRIAPLGIGRSTRSLIAMPSSLFVLRATTCAPTEDRKDAKCAYRGGDALRQQRRCPKLRLVPINTRRPVSIFFPYDFPSPTIRNRKLTIGTPLFRFCCNGMAQEIEQSNEE